MPTLQPDGGPIAADPANEDAIDALAERMRRNPDIIPFVGAGLSRPFGYPDWKELLHEGADRTDTHEKVDPLIDSGDYEEAMSIIADGLRGIMYEDFLKKIFKPRDDAAGPERAAIRFLPALPATPIVTTNIDSVIESVFENHGKPLEVVVGARRERIREAIGLRERCLIKLHGDYRDSVDRILTVKEYESHYGPAETRRVKPFAGIVQHLLAGSSFLFLGFGMEARTKQLLATIAQAGGVRRHWIALTRPSDRRMMYKRAQELGEADVAPLWYEPGGHEQLGPLLHWLIYTAATPTSSLRRFYGQLHERNYVEAVEMGEKALEEGFDDPCLRWNLAVTRELAARELFAKGQVDVALEHLGKIAIRSSSVTSAGALKEAVEFVFGQRPAIAKSYIQRGLSDAQQPLQALRGAMSPDPGALPLASADYGGPDVRIKAVIAFLQGSAEIFLHLVNTAPELRSDPVVKEAALAIRSVNERREKLDETPSGRFKFVKKVSRFLLVATAEGQLATAKKALAASETSRLVPPVLDWYGIATPSARHAAQ